MSDSSQPEDYERSDADPRLIGAIALGLSVFLAASPFVLRAVFPGSDRRGGIEAGIPRPPAPQLQADPSADLARLRSREQDRLDSYGWSDDAKTVVRIPIGEAMRLLAGRGLTGWPSAAGAAPAGQR